MADKVFDPTLSCPIIRGITCAKGDCNFWDETNQECIYFSQMAGKDHYRSLSDALSGEATLDLGGYFKDVTIFVTGLCTVKFHDADHDLFYLAEEMNRIGVPVYFKGINARYVILNAIDPLTYYVEANG